MQVGKSRLSGTIPSWIGSTSTLEFVSVRQSAISGTIPRLDSWAQLVVVAFERSGLSGTLPELSAISLCRDIGFQSTKLSGTLPILSQLTQLEWSGGTRTWLIEGELRLVGFDSSISGTLPRLDALSGLDRLYLVY